jgi:very-short-patch-repair endonuclease
MGELTVPLRGSLAVTAGLVTKGRLRGTGFRRLFPDIYLPAHLSPTLAMRSRGAYLLVVGRGALAGYSALLGMSVRYPGARWGKRVPLVADLMDPRAESAMETRCRLSLVLRGLPRPELQYRVCDELGDHVAWLDMAYPSARVGVEFEGEHHQGTPTFRNDLARYNRLAALGWTVMRASAADVLRNPDRFAAQVRAVLRRGDG